MKARQEPFFPLLFLLLVVIVCLQIGFLYRSFRFNRLLGRIVQSQNSGELKSRERDGKKFERDEDKKNSLIWAFRVEPKTLNPLSSESDIYTRWIAVPYIFEPLMMRDYNDMALKPLLAENYIASRDGLIITFTLKDGIYFSDGYPITSEDVIFTYRTALNLVIDVGDAARFFSEVESAKALDKKKVRFYLKRPYFKAPLRTCLSVRLVFFLLIFIASIILSNLTTKFQIRLAADLISLSSGGRAKKLSWDTTATTGV